MDVVEDQRGGISGIAAVVGCAICMGLSIAVCFVGTFPVFLEPVSKTFGWGMSVYPRVLLLAAIFSCGGGLLSGWLIDRFGARYLMMAGMFGFGASLALLPQFVGSAMGSPMIAAAMGLTASLCGPIATAKVISSWFDRNRGLMLAVVNGAVPAGATALAVFGSSYLIELMGWQTSYKVLGGLIAVAGPLACLLLVRETDHLGAVAEGALPAASGFEVGEALRSRDYWLLVLASMVACGGSMGIVAHLVTWSQERGWSNGTATLAVSLFSLIAPLGSIVSGAVADRISGPRPLAAFYGLPLLGAVLILAFGQSALVPAAILLGIGFSAVGGLLPFLISRLFGVRVVSRLFAIGLGVVTVGIGVGPVLIGLGRDLMGTYQPAIRIAALVLAAAIPLAMSLRRYRTVPAA